MEKKTPEEFLIGKGLDVKPDIHTEEYRQLQFTGKELAELLTEYAQQFQSPVPDSSEGEWTWKPTRQPRRTVTLC